MMPRIPRKRPIDYILPFLIMICTGIIVVLGYQLWDVLSNKDDTQDIYMYSSQGNARVLPWGKGEWENAFNGSRVLRGDTIKTTSTGNVVVEFFKEHYLRIDKNTELAFSELSEKGDVTDASLLLRDGKIWVNRQQQAENDVRFKVRTDHLIIHSTSTVFEIEQGKNEVVRVIFGNVVADVVIEEDGEERVIESLNIGVGQEAVLTDKALSDYEQRKTPSIISAISDDFKDTSFYKWNISEDRNPTDYSIEDLNVDFGVDEEDCEDGDEDCVVEECEEGDEDCVVCEEECVEGDEDCVVCEEECVEGDEGCEEEEECAEGEVDCDIDAELNPPLIAVPSASTYKIDESPFIIKGTTSSTTSRLLVEISGESFDVNTYQPGDTQWEYKLSEVEGNLEKGDNVYTFYAYNLEGDKSEGAKVTIKYDEELDLGVLTEPSVDTYNGEFDSTVTVDEVMVVGSVSGAEKVIVDDYQLGGFEPGDTSWTYYAKESLGNLEPGENIYKVVVESPDGDTKTVDFTITYNKEEVVEEDPVEEEITEDPVEETPAEDPVEEPVEPAEVPGNNTDPTLGPTF